MPPALRAQAARIIGGKTALLARIDAAGGDPTGVKGNEMRDAIVAKFEKLQEPPPAKQSKVRIPALNAVISCCDLLLKQ